MKNDIISTDVSDTYIHHIDRLLERSKLEIFEWFEKPSETTRVKTYIYKDIPLTAALYALYSVLAVVGYRRWLKEIATK